MRTLAPLAAAILACAIGVLALVLAVSSPRRALADKGNGEHESTTAITGVTVVDPTTGKRRADRTILVERGRIATIAPTRELHVDPRARLVDAAGKWAIFGLVDAHVPFFQSGGPYTRPDIVDLRARFACDRELARTRDRIPVTLARWLASGVTAVAGLGGGSWTFDVRAIARRTDAAPDVAVAGRILSTVGAEALDTGDPSVVPAKSPARTSKPRPSSFAPSRTPRTPPASASSCTPRSSTSRRRRSGRARARNLARVHRVVRREGLRSRHARAAVNRAWRRRVSGPNTRRSDLDRHAPARASWPTRARLE
jgi:hypothetical protein